MSGWSGTALARRPGTIATIAGNPVASGAATSLGQTPFAVGGAPAIGGFDVVDQGASVIREVDPTGHETTIAGDGAIGYAGDGGPATSADLAVHAVVRDREGDLLIDDQQHEVVRLVAAQACPSSCPYGLPATTAGDIYTIVGRPNEAAFSGDGGPAANAQLSSPRGSRWTSTATS